MDSDSPGEVDGSGSEHSECLADGFVDVEVAQHVVGVCGLGVVEKSSAEGAYPAEVETVGEGLRRGYENAQAVEGCAW